MRVGFGIGTAVAAGVLSSLLAVGVSGCGIAPRVGVSDAAVFTPLHIDAAQRAYAEDVATYSGGDGSDALSPFVGLQRYFSSTAKSYEDVKLRMDAMLDGTQRGEAFAALSSVLIKLRAEYGEGVDLPAGDDGVAVPAISDADLAELSKAFGVGVEDSPFDRLERARAFYTSYVLALLRLYGVDSRAVDARDLDPIGVFEDRVGGSYAAGLLRLGLDVMDDAIRSAEIILSDGAAPVATAAELETTREALAQTREALRRGVEAGYLLAGAVNAGSDGNELSTSAEVMRVFMESLEEHVDAIDPADEVSGQLAAISSAFDWMDRARFAFGQLLDVRAVSDGPEPDSVRILIREARQLARETSIFLSDPRYLRGSQGVGGLQLSGAMDAGALGDVSPYTYSPVGVILRQSVRSMAERVKAGVASETALVAGLAGAEKVAGEAAAAVAKASGEVQQKTSAETRASEAVTAAERALAGASSADRARLQAALDAAKRAKADATAAKETAEAELKTAQDDEKAKKAAVVTARASLVAVRRDVAAAREDLESLIWYEAESAARLATPGSGPTDRLYLLVFQAHVAPGTRADTMARVSMTVDESTPARVLFVHPGRTYDVSDSRSLDSATRALSAAVAGNVGGAGSAALDASSAERTEARRRYLSRIDKMASDVDSADSGARLGWVFRPSNVRVKEKAFGGYEVKGYLEGGGRDCSAWVLVPAGTESLTFTVTSEYASINAWRRSWQSGGDARTMTVELPEHFGAAGIGSAPGVNFTPSE